MFSITLMVALRKGFAICQDLFRSRVTVMESGSDPGDARGPGAGTDRAGRAAARRRARAGAASSRAAGRAGPARAWRGRGRRSWVAPSLRAQPSVRPPSASVRHCRALHAFFRGFFSGARGRARAGQWRAAPPPPPRRPARYARSYLRAVY